MTSNEEEKRESSEGVGDSVPPRLTSIVSRWRQVIDYVRGGVQDVVFPLTSQVDQWNHSRQRRARTTLVGLSLIAGGLGFLTSDWLMPGSTENWLKVWLPIPGATLVTVVGLEALDALMSHH